jgi:glyceraldehyde 3-phosphate dehydrogenase
LGKRRRFTSTANVTIDLKNAPGLEKDIISSLKDTVVRIPVTQAVIYGWYDNEMASYVKLFLK